VTQFPPTCFYYVQKGSPVFLKEKEHKALLREFRSQAQLQKSITYCLLMIASYSAKLQLAMQE
jgi:hypothetical protein